MKNNEILRNSGSSLMMKTLLATAISMAMSNTAYSADETVGLEDLQVWGTEVRASSVKLETETLTIKQADHISDLLRTIPGVDVGGAHSLNQRITIRSMDDKDLRISIDGANQNTYMYHHMGNLQIHADILQAVDVEIGTNSVLNGGLGGAVNFETKSAKELLREGENSGGRAQLSYGDNSGSSLALTGYSQISEKLDVLGYFNTVDRDNFEVGGGVIEDFNGNKVPDTDGTVRGLEGELTDALIKFGFDLDDNQRLEIGYETYADEGDYSYRPDMGLATDLAITNNLGIPLLWPTEFTRDTLTINYELDWGSNSYLKVSTFNNVSELQRDESGWAENPAFAASAADVEGEATNSGLNFLGETELDNHTLTYGAEIINYDTHYKSIYNAGGEDTSEEDARNTAIYLQDRFQINNQFAVIPGIRYNQFDLDSTVVDDSFDEITGALAAEYQASDSVLLKISTTQLFKGPEIGEVFTGAGLYDEANPDIDAETGTNTELSIAFEDASLGADRFSAGITIFDTQLDDYIYDYAPPPATSTARSWKDNIGNMSIDGYEAYLGYDKGPLRTLLSYSKADSKLDAFTEYSTLDEARLDRKQGDTISLNVDYDIPSSQMTIHWDSLIVDDISTGIDLDGASTDNAKDGYTVHNISARWAPKDIKGLTLTVGVDNLLDEFYASQSSRTGLSTHPRFGQLYLQDYEPGRNFKLTASYVF